MKRTGILLAAALVLAMPFAVTDTVTAETVTVIGGTDKVVFDDSAARDFDFFTEFNQPMYILQNRLYAPVLAESKAIYKNGTYSDVEVSVDISAIVPYGNIDGGIIVQTRGANNAANGLTGWNVNVEHNADATSFALKLHRFENNRWLGAKKEIYNIKYMSDTVHLRVVVKTGVLYAYLDAEDPIFTYNIGAASGKVGLRAYYAPMYFENFSVTSPMILVEPEQLEAKIKELVGFDYAPYTEDSAQKMKDAVEYGKVQLESETSQADIDKAYADILAAEQALIRIKTRADLDELIQTAQAIISDVHTYTKNSISSLKVVVDKCVAAEDADVSYWYQVLEHRIKSAVKYEGGENE